MIYQMGLRDAMTTDTLAHDLLTSAQGPCQAHRQPFGTVFTHTEFITSRKQIHVAATFVFFGDITLAFPAVNRDIFLVRLADAGVPSKLWQYVLALHRTRMYRILHGNATNNPYIEFKKGLTEGGRLSPLLWGLYVADLVNTIRRDFPDLASASCLPLRPHDLLAILLYVDDFCSIVISAAQLLSTMQTTRTGASATG